MESDWPTTTIRKVAKVFDGPYFTPKKTDNGPIFLGISSLSMGRLDIAKSAHLSEEDFIKWTKRVTPQKDDVVFSYETRIGEVAIIPERLRCCLGRRLGLVRPDKSKLNPRFFLYQYISPQFQALLRSRTVPGSTVDRIMLKEFPDFPIKLPPLDIQDSIAHILGTFDEKIDLNRRMNQTLESMARSIFKSWFVDFDGCTEFQDSELGKIPKGWEVRPLSELCKKSQYGYTASANEDEIGPKFLRIKDINKFDWIEWTTVPYCDIKQKDKEKYKLYPGDIVVARMADPGHAALIEEHVDSVFASYLIRFRPLADYHERYLQYWFRSDFYWNLITGRQTGSTRANINAKVLGSFPVLVPHIDEVKSFKIMIDPIRERVVANVNESNTLAKLRDTLLPKLISGELLVPDAEKLAGEML